MLTVVLIALSTVWGGVGGATAGARPVGSEASAKRSPIVSAMNGWTLWTGPSSQWGPQLALMRAKGVTTVRSDAPWATVQPRPASGVVPAYDFSRLDAWVTALALHHLTWMPILDDTPGWAKRCVGQCPPISLGWFATFAKALAARYGPGGSFWTQNPALPRYPVRYFEIWNEENGTQFWSTGPNAAQYAQMYSQARSAIRSVNPRAQVIVGGLGAGDAYYFVKRMLSAMPSLRGNIDGFGLHPYGRDAATTELLVVLFREGLDLLGQSSVPIDLTEFGWPKGNEAESWRAQMMNEAARALSGSNCGVRVLAPYAWVHNPSDGPDFALSRGQRVLPSGNGWFSGLRSASRTRTAPICPVVSGPRRSVRGASRPSG